jgi:hypothetical protein
MKINFVILVLFVTLVSCSTSQIVTNGTKAHEIKELAFFKPLTTVYYIENGNNGNYSQVLSDSLQSSLTTIIDTLLKPTVKLKSLRVDSITNSKIELELVKITNTLEKIPFIDKIKIPTYLDSIMVTQNVDYALCVIHSGFIRSNSNYASKMAGGLLLGIATLGMVYTVPIKGSSMMYCFILDHKKGNIAFYRTSKMTDTNPIKYQKRQIEKIFNGYFNIAKEDNFYY